MRQNVGAASEGYGETGSPGLGRQGAQNWGDREPGVIGETGSPGLGSACPGDLRQVPLRCRVIDREPQAWLFSSTSSNSALIPLQLKR